MTNKSALKEFIELHEMDLREAMNTYFILGTPNCPPGKKIEEILLEALQGGITLFQFREKGEGALTGEEKLNCALLLKDMCHAFHIPFIVNDDLPLALACNADGLHVGQEDGDLKDIRKNLGSIRWLGVSAHNVEEATRAVELGADYLGVGPIYPTNSKDDAGNVCGPEMLRQIREADISLPLVGIGGITLDKKREVLQAGGDGVSIISAIAQAVSPQEAAKEFRNS